jgi:XTP/dITP diphosphohydrolase
MKADFFCKKSHLTTLSDDSGLEIDCLAGEPGIFLLEMGKRIWKF